MGLVCPSAPFADSLGEYFQAKVSTEKPVVQLKLEFEDHDGFPTLPNNLYTTKKLTPGGFTISDGLISGNYDKDSRTGEIKVKTILSKGHFTRVFEQFLYQVFYSARNAIGYDAFLIHSSGVIRVEKGNRDGFLFVGASEAGKSTVAELSRNQIITNDEMNLIEFTNNGPVLHATPFNGLFREKETDISAPLKAVLLLKQGPEHCLREVSRRKAVTLLASQIAPPVGIEDMMNQITGLELLEMADRLSQAAPIKEMTFLPDPGFWAEINSTFPLEKSTIGRK